MVLMEPGVRRIYTPNSLLYNGQTWTLYSCRVKLGSTVLNMFRATLSASFPEILDEFEFLRKPRICVPYL